MRLLIPVPKKSLEFFKAQNPNLVQKRVQVRKDGKTFYRMQWVVPGQSGGTGPASEKQLDLFGGDVPVKPSEKVQKYYVTMKREGRPDAAWLAGPYDTHEEALARVDEARGHANSADPRSVFDAFGTASYEAEEGKHRKGVLNDLMKPAESKGPTWSKDDPEAEKRRAWARGEKVEPKPAVKVETNPETAELKSPYSDPETVENHENGGVETRLMKYTDGPHAGKFGVRIRDTEAEKNVGLTIFPNEGMAREYFAESVKMNGGKDAEEKKYQSAKNELDDLHGRWKALDRSAGSAFDRDDHHALRAANKEIGEIRDKIGSIMNGLSHEHTSRYVAESTGATMQKSQPAADNLRSRGLLD